MAEKDTTAAEDVVKRMLKSGRRGRVRPGDIADAFVQKAGGPDEFAQKLWDDYQAARVRSPVAAQRITAGILALYVKEQEGGKAAGPVTKDALVRRMTEIIQSIRADHAADQAGPAAPAAADDQAAADQDAARPHPAPAGPPQEPPPAAGPGPDAAAP